jgi:hypothetical protein
MYEKTIKFTDFFGNERTEKRYFNLSEAEVLDAQFDRQGDFSQLIQGIANTKDTETLGRLFKEIILRSYGEPSPDGIYFNKSKEIRDRFENSALYNALYTELLFDADAASDFINHVIPVDSIQKIVEKSGKANEANTPALTTV